MFALQELEYRGYEIPSIPVFYIRCNENTIKKNVLIATSTNHCVTKYSLEHFIKDEKLLKQLAFNEGTLIDFWESSDIEKFFEKTKNVSNKTATVDEYLNGIKGGLL